MPLVGKKCFSAMYLWCQPYAIPYFGLDGRSLLHVPCRQVCATEQGMVFRVLRLKQGIHSHLASLDAF